VVVSDGTASSAPFPLQVSVTPVNDVPVITGQQSLSTTQGQPVTLSVTDFTVEDPDNIYPNDFTLSIVEGANYTVSGNQVVPAAEFSGVLTVGVVVNDGQANSAVFQATITVAVEDGPPVITGHTPLETPEDNPITLEPGHLTVEDPDDNYPTG